MPFLFPPATLRIFPESHDSHSRKPEHPPLTLKWWGFALRIGKTPPRTRTPLSVLTARRAMPSSRAVMPPFQTEGRHQGQANGNIHHVRRLFHQAFPLRLDEFVTKLFPLGELRFFTDLNPRLKAGLSWVRPPQSKPLPD